jgi:tape measure domain-containing protein
VNSLNKMFDFFIRLQDLASPRIFEIIRNLQRMETGVQRVQKSFQRVGMSIGSFFDNASKKARGFTTVLQRMPEKIFNLPNLIGASVVGLTFGAAIDASSFKQTQSKALEILLGNKAGGDALLSQATEFARVTPFGTKDVLGITKSLAQNFAPSEIMNLLSGIGDVGAANNFSPQILESVTLAVNQIKRRGFLQGDELNQLADAGVPVTAMLENLAKLNNTDLAGVGKLQAQGLISADQAIWSMLEAIRTKVSGGTLGGFMQVMGQEIPGLLSTLKDVPFTIFQDLDTAPLKGFLTNLVKLTDTSSTLGGKFKNAVNRTFGAVLKGVFGPLTRATEPEAIIGWLEDMQPRFETFGTWWEMNMPRVIAFARDFGTGFVSAFQSAWAILEPFLPVLNGLGTTTANVAGTHGVFAGKLAGVLTMLGLVNVATGGLAGGLASGLLPVLGRVVGSMGVWGVAIAAVTGGLVWMYSKVSWFKTGTDEIFAGLTQTFNTWRDAVGAVFDFIGSKIESFKKALASIPGVKLIGEGLMPNSDAPATAAAQGLNMGSSYDWFKAMNPWLNYFDFNNGLVQGILGSQQPLKDAIDLTIDNTAGRFAQQMQIHSPSRLMQWQGQMLGLGLASGILATMPNVASAMAELNAPPVELASTATWLESSSVSSKASKGFNGEVNIYNTFNVTGNESAKQISAELETQLRFVVERVIRDASYEVTGGDYDE